MQNLGIYISDLLAEHDCVIVPGFGGFVARPAPAHFAKAGNFLLPPGKSLVFNKNLQQSDGLLVTYISLRLQITYRAATELVEQWVAGAKKQLEERHRLELERTGVLYFSPEHNLLFEPAANSNHQVTSFGLSAVLAIPVEAHQDLAVQGKTYREPVATPRNKTLTRISLAVSSLLLLAFLTFLTADHLPLRNAFATLNPFAPKENVYKTQNYGLATLFAPHPGNVAAVVKENSTLTVAATASRTFVVLSDTAASDKTKVYKPVSHSSENCNFAAPFQIVVGCFAVEQNARRLIEQLRQEGIPAGIAGQNTRGLHVVSVAGFTTESMARTKLGQVKQRFPSAWIMLK